MEANFYPWCVLLIFRDVLLSPYVYITLNKANLLKPQSSPIQINAFMAAWPGWPKARSRFWVEEVGAFYRFIVCVYIF